MVVDTELYELLLRLDGSRTLDQALAELRVARRERRAARQVIESLGKRGIVAAGETAFPSPAHDETEIRLENVAVNLTSRCNLRCPCCYNLSRLSTSAHGELEPAEIIAFLDSVRPALSEQPTLAILGGEPLLRPDALVEVARCARSQGFAVQVSTNGVLVSAPFARRAAEIGLEVQVSLDGPTAAINGQLRPAGSFDQAVEGVRTLVEHGVDTTISMVCHQISLEHLEAYYELGLELGVNQVRFIPLKRIGGALDRQNMPVPTLEIVEKAKSLFDRRPEFIPLAGLDAFSILAGSCSCGIRRVSCGTGRQTVLLDADGSLYPCLNLNRPEFCLGNIRSSRFDFARLWAESPVLQQVRDRTGIDDAESACRSCTVRYWCLGGCRGENYAVSGRLNGRAPNCRDQRAAILEMMWILAERPELRRRVTPRC